MRLLWLVPILVVFPAHAGVIELEVDGVVTAGIADGSVIVDVFRGGGASLSITCSGGTVSFDPASSAVGFVFHGSEASLLRALDGGVILQIEVPEQSGGEPRRIDIPADGSEQTFETDMTIEEVTSIPEWSPPAAPLTIEVDGQVLPGDVFDPASGAIGFVMGPGHVYRLTCSPGQGSFVMVTLVEN